MSEKNFIVYKSSAGSGKTFTLAKEYVKLALRGRFYYKHILAVTFTNKAAEEMRERVIHFLTQIAKGEGEIIQILESETHWSISELQQRANASLTAILHGYSFFSISTIDTFFHQIIRTFTREMGLQGNFSIEMDLDKVLDTVITNMLDEVHENKTLKKWLVDFSKERLLEGKNWEFKSDVKSLAYELFKEEYRMANRAVATTTDTEVEIQDLVEQLNQTIFSFQKTLKKSAKELVDRLQKNDLAPEDLAYGKSGLISFVLKLSNGDYSPPGKRTREALVNTDKWASKSSKKNAYIIQLASSELAEMLSLIVAFYDENQKDYHTAVLLKQNIYAYGILSYLKDKISLYREEEEVMLISDFSAFLNDIIKGSDAPYIYEKVGTRIRHYLIDEFQDTSGTQWENFYPLIEDSLASGHENLIVGDVKQSIYRWRGGDFNLLLEGVNQQMGVSGIEEKNLNANFRSLPTLVDFNNQLFGQAAPWIEAKLGLQNQSISVRKLSLAFSEHEQKAIKTSSEGFVSVTFYEEESAETYNETIGKEVIRSVEQLQDNAYELKDIAILVRSHMEAQVVVQALMAKKEAAADTTDYRYDVVSSESMFLKTSGVVSFLISVLTFLDDDKNQIAFREMLFSYQNRILNNDLSYDELFLGKLNGDLLPDNFWKYREVLKRLPFYELIETLIRIFELNSVTSDLAFLISFQDCALNFAKDGGASISDFLIWWKETGIKKTVNMPDDLDAIKVLTIHKSKGLQFKVVLLPFCNWGLDHNATFNNFIWVDPSSVYQHERFTALPVKYSRKMQETHFDNVYNAEQLAAHLDNLNILYVGLTRAEEEMIIMCKTSKKTDALKSVSDLIFKSIQSPDAMWKQEGNQFYKGKPKLSEKAATIDDQNSFILDEVNSHPWRKRVSTKTSRQSYKGIVDERTKTRHFGILIHDLLSSVRIIDDIKIAIEDIKALSIEQEAKNKAISILEQIMTKPEIQHWFSGEFQVRNEAAILQKNDTSKRPDRVMTRGKEAIILDYKTGLPDVKDQIQLREYKQLLKQMGYQQVDAYLLYLGSLELIKT